MNWKEKRINAINRKIKKGYLSENYINEHYYIINSSATNKKQKKDESEHKNNDYINACLE